MKIINIYIIYNKRSQRDYLYSPLSKTYTRFCPVTYNILICHYFQISRLKITFKINIKRHEKLFELFKPLEDKIICNICVYVIYIMS